MPLGIVGRITGIEGDRVVVPSKRHQTQLYEKDALLRASVGWVTAGFPLIMSELLLYI